MSTNTIFILIILNAVLAVVNVFIGPFWPVSLFVLVAAVVLLIMHSRALKRKREEFWL